MTQAVDRETLFSKRKRLIANATALTLTLSAFAAGNAFAADIPLNGTLSLKDATPEQAVAIQSSDKDSYFGSAVANIGDFNGDGKDDFAIGEPRSSSKGTKEGGVVRVILGGDSLKKGFTVGRGGESFTIFNSADTYHDHYGATVAKAGDVNGDGLADLIFGAPDSDADARFESKTEATAEKDVKVNGRAYVVFGRKAVSDVDVAASFGGFEVDGESQGDAAGSSVGSIKDLNGDGRSEIVVGAERSDPGQREDAGSVYVIFGKTDSSAVTLGQSVVNSGQGIRIDGPTGGQAGGAYLGRSVDSIGDLNGDGKDELLLTAPRAGNNKPGMPAGNAYVVWGTSTPQTMDLEYVQERKYGYRITASLSKNGAGSERSTNGDFLGQSISAIGDVNGDKKPDFAIGSHLTDINNRLNPGRAWVVYGKSDGENVDLDTIGSGGFSVTGIDEQDQAGYDLTAAGDYNADGIDDIAVASPYADPVGVEGAGAVYVIWGSKDGQKDLDLAEFGNRATRISGPAVKSALGVSVTSAGDVNGDGGVDLLIGAPGGIYGGESYSIAGAAWFTFGAQSKEAGHLQDPAATDPGYAEAVKLDGCTPTYNTQALVIDDGYIDDLDPKRYRGLALETYAAKPRNRGTVFGVTGFPDDSPEPVFVPQVLGKSQVDPVSRLHKEIDGADGFPGWAGLLASAANDNPSAQARIYAMDGVGFSYVNKLDGFTDGAPPSYVIAVGHEYEKSDAKAMKKFATETGGKYYAVDSGLGVTKAVNAIESRLRCDIDREQFQQVLNDEGSEDVNVVGLEDGTHSVDMVASWAGDWRDRFEIEDVQVLRNTDEDDELEVVQDFDSEDIDDSFDASASKAASKKLTGVKRRGLRALHLTGLKSGKLRVKVKAKKLHGSGRVLTQISQSRFRK